jgi:hypothetical protein
MEFKSDNQRKAVMASFKNRFAVNPIKRLIATRKVIGDKTFDFPVDVKVDYYGNPYIYVGEGKTVTDFFDANVDRIDPSDSAYLANIVNDMKQKVASHATDRDSTGEIILSDADIRLMEKYMSPKFSLNSDIAKDITYIKKQDDAAGIDRSGKWKEDPKYGKMVRMDYLIGEAVKKAPAKEIGGVALSDYVTDFSRTADELKKDAIFKGVRNNMQIWVKDGVEYGITAGGAVIDLRYLFSVNQQKELIPGGLASGRPDDDFCPVQLEKGIEVEKEHVIKFTDKGNVKKFKDTDLAKAKEIAKDHLAEIPDYYDRLEAMEEGAKGDGVFIDVVADKKA